MNEQIINKYLSGIATHEEQQKLLDWLHESPANKATFFELKAVWHSRQQLSDRYEKNLNKSLEQINNRIDSTLNRNKNKSRNLVVMLSSAVAILLFLVAISYQYFTASTDLIADTSLYTYINDGDSVKTIVLPDGTEVWLAGNSTLSRPVTFTGDQRKVHLDGTAFFEVIKDIDHPFIVQTDATEIKVLGTAFSINSRKSDKQCETILMTGSIQFKRLGGESVVTLHPGQQALYSKETKALEISEVDANALTSWRFGLTSLSNASAADILKQLEEAFGIRIKMDISTIKNHTYNFSFKRSSGPGEALDQLSLITGEAAIIMN